MTISPDSFREEAVGRFWVRRAVLFGIVVFASISGSCWDVCKREGRARRTMVLSETRPEAGLMLFRVLREGLWLRECLGVTAGRANAADETGSRTLAPDPGAAGENNAPRRHLVAPGLARLHRQFGWIVVFSCLPEAEGECRELAGERHPRELLAHAASDHLEVEVL